MIGERGDHARETTLIFKITKLKYTVCCVKLHEILPWIQLSGLQDQVLKAANHQFLSCQ